MRQSYLKGWRFIELSEEHFYMQLKLRFMYKLSKFEKKTSKNINRQINTWARSTNKHINLANIQKFKVSNRSSRKKM